MVGVISRPDTFKKLEILSADAQYDLACACGTNKDQHRRRSEDGKWVYPITLPNGAKTTLFKTLLSNVCANDCKYCPLRQGQNIKRCSLTPEETAKVFIDYYNRRKVFGLFLSSGLQGSPDTTMAQLNTTAKILRRKHNFKGYIHLKVIPGASDAAIEQAVSLASAVSLNIETPGSENLTKLSTKKEYIKDIINPIKLISSLTGRGQRYSRVKQTTQFIVGAAGESDADIVKYTYGLYKRLSMHRVYFSAYQKGLGDENIAGEQITQKQPADTFMREHRLYQVDFLFRKYGFTESDIFFDEDGDLSLSADPKEIWAKRHPERFPINVNKASKNDLLKVPGIGHVTANRIIKRRKQAKLISTEDITETGRITSRFEKAKEYLTF